MFTYTKPTLDDDGVFTCDYLSEILALVDTQQKAVPDWRSQLSDYGREDAHDLLRQTSGDYGKLRELRGIIYACGITVRRGREWCRVIHETSAELSTRHDKGRNNLSGEDWWKLELALTFLTHFRCTRCNAIFLVPIEHKPDTDPKTISYYNMKPWFSCPLCAAGTAQPSLTSAQPNGPIILKPGRRSVPLGMQKDPLLDILREFIPGLDSVAVPEHGTIYPMNLADTEDKIESELKAMLAASDKARTYIKSVLERDLNPPVCRP